MCQQQRHREQKIDKDKEREERKRHTQKRDSLSLSLSLLHTAGPVNLNLKTTKLFFLPEGVVCLSCIINTKLIGSKSWYKDLPSKVYFCLVRISTRTFRGHHNRDRQPISTTLLSKANSFLFDSHSTQQDVHAHLVTHGHFRGHFRGHHNR